MEIIALLKKVISLKNDNILIAILKLLKLFLSVH